MSVSDNNEIEITVRIQDKSAVGMAAVTAGVKSGGAAAAAEATKAGDQIGENLANGLTRDSGGRLRNAMGRFASDAEKEAAGIGGGHGIKVPLTVDGDPFEHEFRAAMQEAEQAGRDAEQALTRTFGDIEKASRTVRSAAGELGPTLDGVGNSARGAGNGLGEVDKKASGAGGSANGAGLSFAFMGSRAGQLGAAFLALGPALAAVPALAVGAAVGMGTLAGAFSGAIGAIKDYAAQQSSAAQSGASGAATAFANAVAIRNGEQAIADAKRQAAQAAVTSARQITDAQQGLVDAERQAAIAAQSSADAVAAANQRLENATLSLAQAQATLTLAERDGVNVLKDLNLASADAANSVVDAQLAVQQAEENANKAKGNSLLTDLQKKQAAQQLVDAQQHLLDAQQKATEAQQAANDANAKGVDGSTAVVAAQNGVRSATQGLADAQQGLARAQTAAGNQQIASNEAVAKAQRAVADAYSSAAQQQVASQQTVDRAVQALADTQRQQALAADAAGASNNKFATDMAKLTQPGRDFVNQVLGMKDGLHNLSVTAQTATLPGFTQMLKDSQGMFPTINQGIKDMGGAIGGAAIKFGDLMNSKAFKGDMQAILKQAADFTTQIADGIVGMVGGVADAAKQAGPIVDGLGQGFKDLLKTGIPDFFKGLAQHASGSGQALQGILDFVTNIAGPLGTVAGAFSAALGPGLKILSSPDVAASLKSIGDSVASIFLSMSPLVTLIAQGLAGALHILAPLLKDVAGFLEANNKWLTPLAGLILGVWAALKLWAAIQLTLNFLMLDNPIGALILAISGLVIGLIYCWDHFKGFRDFVKGLWLDIAAFFSAGASAVGGFLLHTIPEAAKKGWSLVYDYTIKPVKDAFDWVTGKTTGFGAMIKWTEGLPGKLASAGAGLWNWVTAPLAGIAGTIAQLFKNVINGVLVGVNWVIGRIDTISGGLSGALKGLLGFGAPEIPHIDPIPYLRAAGGPVGGLSAIIGEAGVEMMRMPDGSVVMPHANTMSAIQSGSGPGGGRLQLEWVGGPPLSDTLAAALFELFRHHIRVRGGNVQNVLGSGF